MSLVIKILGILFACIGLLELLKPLLINKLLDFFKYGNRIYLVAVLRFIFAVIFLLAARECRVPWLVIVFGVLLLISGALVLIIGPDRLRPMIDWFQKQTLFARAMGLVTIVIGAILIYAA
jgi:hypothetical protein